MYTQNDINDILTGLGKSLAEKVTDLNSQLNTYWQTVLNNKTECPLYIKLQTTKNYDTTSYDFLFEETNNEEDELDNIKNSMFKSILFKTDANEYGQHTAFKLTLYNKDKKDLFGNDEAIIDIASPFRAFMFGNGVVGSLRSLNKFKDCSRIFVYSLLKNLGKGDIGNDISLVSKGKQKIENDIARSDKLGELYKEVASFSRKFAKEHAGVFNTNSEEAMLKSLKDLIHNGFKELCTNLWLEDCNEIFAFIGQKNIINACFNAKRFNEEYFSKQQNKQLALQIKNNDGNIHTNSVLISEIGKELFSSRITMFKNDTYLKDHFTTMNSITFLENEVVLNRYNLQDLIALSYLSSNDVNTRFMSLYDVFLNNNAYLFGQHQEGITNYLRTLIDIDGFKTPLNFTDEISSKFKDLVFASNKIETKQETKNLNASTNLADVLSFPNTFGCNFSLRFVPNGLQAPNRIEIAMVKPVYGTINTGPGYADEIFTKLINEASTQSNLQLEAEASLQKNSSLVLITDIAGQKETIPLFANNEDKLAKNLQTAKKELANMFIWVGLKARAFKEHYKYFLNLLNLPAKEALKELEKKELAKLDEELFKETETIYKEETARLGIGKDDDKNNPLEEIFGQINKDGSTDLQASLKQMTKLNPDKVINLIYGGFRHLPLNLLEVVLNDEHAINLIKKVQQTKTINERLNDVYSAINDSFRRNNLPMLTEFATYSKQTQKDFLLLIDAYALNDNRKNSILKEMLPSLTANKSQINDLIEKFENSKISADYKDGSIMFINVLKSLIDLAFSKDENEEGLSEDVSNDLDFEIESNNEDDNEELETVTENKPKKRKMN